MDPKHIITRTHSMARHRKSPRSWRNLMVIDPLSPSQGHQFDHKLQFSVYPGLLLIPLNLIFHMTMFRKFNFWPLPKAPGGGDPKNCASACAIHVSNSQTKSGWILEKKKIWPPNPPRYPKVPPLGMTQAAEWKSSLICYISFVCKKIHKVWFKNLWNWLCNSDLMIFDLLTPPKGPRGRGPKKWCRCMCQIWLNFGKKKKLTPQPPTVPPALGHDPGGRLKIPSDMFYIFHLWEVTLGLV